MFLSDNVSSAVADKKGALNCDKNMNLVHFRLLHFYKAAKQPNELLIILSVQIFLTGSPDKALELLPVITKAKFGETLYIDAPVIG